MQTFLPYPDFARSTACLDNRRLGKQRVEAMQILKIIQAEFHGITGLACSNHPAVKMWKGWHLTLMAYHDACIKEWISRGFRNTMRLCGTVELAQRPPWLSDPRFCASHRAALLYKDPIHYGQFGWTEKPELAYWWPTKQEA